MFLSSPRPKPAREPALTTGERWTTQAFGEVGGPGVRRLEAVRGNVPMVGSHAEIVKSFETPKNANWPSNTE
jgi:hypothetical protein